MKSRSPPAAIFRVSVSAPCVCVCMAIIEARVGKGRFRMEDGMRDASSSSCSSCWSSWSFAGIRISSGSPVRGRDSGLLCADGWCSGYLTPSPLSSVSTSPSLGPQLLHGTISFSWMESRWSTGAIWWVTQLLVPLSYLIWYQ